MDATAKKQIVMLVCGEGRPGKASLKCAMLLGNHHRSKFANVWPERPSARKTAAAKNAAPANRFAMVLKTLDFARPIPQTRRNRLIANIDSSKIVHGTMLPNCGSGLTIAKALNFQLNQKNAAPVRTTDAARRELWTRQRRTTDFWSCARASPRSLAGLGIVNRNVADQREAVGKKRL